MFKTVPKAFELQRLRRLKEAVLGSGIKSDKPKMGPADDWMTNLESRIASLERGLGIDSQPTKYF